MVSIFTNTERGEGGIRVDPQQKAKKRRVSFCCSEKE